MKRTSFLGIAALLLLVCGAHDVRAQSFDFNVIDDTILLTNGALPGDTEDNFGGRTEIIGNINSGNFRHILLRFDVSAAAAEISNGGLQIAEASLTLNPRDSRAASQPSAGLLDVYGLVSGNQGWREGTKTGSQAGLSGQFGAVSARFLATPSEQSTSTIDGSPLPDPKLETDGTQWFSQGGGTTTSPPATTLFDVAGDTSNQVLGTGDLSTLDATNDADFTIPIDPTFLSSFLTEWLNAPLMSDDDGGMQSSNAGLVIVGRAGNPNGQVFFESIEGTSAQAAVLNVTFGTPPKPGDVDSDQDTDLVDLDLLRANLFRDFGMTEPTRLDGDLNRDGVVNFVDYRQWKTEYDAENLPASFSVPEPTAAAIFLMGLVAFGGARRRG